jgi:hypothetical protein
VQKNHLKCHDLFWDMAPLTKIGMLRSFVSFFVEYQPYSLCNLPSYQCEIKFRNFFIYKLFSQKSQSFKTFSGKFALPLKPAPFLCYKINILNAKNGIAYDIRSVNLLKRSFTFMSQNSFTKRDSDTCGCIQTLALRIISQAFHHCAIGVRQGFLQIDYVI